MNHNQILINYIHAIGPVINYKSNLFIIDNTGEYGKQRSEAHYIVFVQGGYQFNISKEKTGLDYEYNFDAVWDGPFDMPDAEHIIKVLSLLGHSINQ